MQPCGREMRGIPSSLSGQIAPTELQNGNQQIQGGGMQGHFDPTSASHDDFFEQMLSSLPSAWPDIGTPKSLWVLGDPNGSASADASGGQKPFNMALAGKAPDEVSEGLQYASYDDSSLLASRLRQHQISDGGKPMALQIHQQHHPAQQQMLLSGGDSGMLPLPLSLGCSGLVDRIRDEGGEGFYNGFGGSLQPAAAQTGSQKHFQHPQGAQNYGASPVGGAAPAAGHGGGSAAPPRQRVRARRGQATDPHSIAERLRRERIAERMKDLQGLVPNANKTDKASMLDEIIDYLKFLQLQVKVLSMSRLGGAAAVAPLVADVSSEAGRGGGGSESLAVTEHQVAKLMEEDMGSAMQYLQGKGLCLMPISLASAISTATFIPHDANNNGGDAPPSPSMSVLTGQSAVANDASKGANSLSRS